MKTPEEIAEKACSIQGSMRGYATSIVAVRIAQRELAQKVTKLLAEVREHDPEGSTMDSVRGAKAMERKFHAAVTELDALLTKLAEDKP